MSKFTYFLQKIGPGAHYSKPSNALLKIKVDLINVRNRRRECPKQTKYYEAFFLHQQYIVHEFLLYPTAVMVLIYIFCCLKEDVELVIVHFKASRKGVRKGVRNRQNRCAYQ